MTYDGNFHYIVEENNWKYECYSRRSYTWEILGTLLCIGAIILLIALLCCYIRRRRNRGSVLSPSTLPSALPSATSNTPAYLQQQCAGAAYPVIHITTAHSVSPYPAATPHPGMTVTFSMPAAGPHITSGVPYPTSRGPYPTTDGHYPTSSTPYPTSGTPYSTAALPTYDQATADMIEKQPLCNSSAQYTRVYRC